MEIYKAFSPAAKQFKGRKLLQGDRDSTVSTDGAAGRPFFRTSTNTSSTATLPNGQRLHTSRTSTLTIPRPAKAQTSKEYSSETELGGIVEDAPQIAKTTTSDSAPEEQPLLQGGNSGRNSDSAHMDAGSSQNSSATAAFRGGKGVLRIAGAGLRTPMDFTYGLAQGFRNAPKLYGDTTVRDMHKITGIKSGFSAAGKVSPLSTALILKHS